MSFAGFEIFEKNLRRVMETKAFKEGDFATQCELGHRLLNSKYGLGVIGVVSRLSKSHHPDQRRCRGQ